MSCEYIGIDRILFSYFASEIKDVCEMLLRYEAALEFASLEENVSKVEMQAIDTSLQILDDLKLLSETIIEIGIDENSVRDERLISVLKLERSRRNLALHFKGINDFLDAKKDLRIEIF